jgi:PRTRC genetic system ThiF family protein
MSLFHYVSKSILNPYDPVSVVLVGCGGTGCQVLSGLARINEAILSLGHPTGLSVVVVDPDTISPSNIGRQSFAKPDVNSNKARVAVERVNRFYGLNWRHIPSYFNSDLFDNDDRVEFVLSAIDNVKGRREIHEELKNNPRCKYWLDFGNAERTSQVILSTVSLIKQPQGGCGSLPNIFDFFPNLEQHEDVTAPSCSLAEALESQDLFINQITATFGLDLIWQMFRYGKLENHGAYVNLENYSTKPITIRSSFKRFKEAV